MKRPFVPAFCLLLPLVFSGSILAADPPGILSHQGRIAVAGVNFDGAGHFKFALVDAAGSTSFWSNDDTSTTGDEPTAAVPVTLEKGHYSVLLGDAPMVEIPAGVFAENSDVRLRIWFSADGGSTFEQLSPDRRIASVGYALSSGPVDGANIAAGSIPTAALAPGTVPSFVSTGDNDFFGPLAGNTTVTGSFNTGVGLRSLQAVTGGVSNTAIGFNSLRDATVASSNTAVGTGSLRDNVEGDRNTAIGQTALKSVTGSDNIAIGAGAGSLLTDGDDNIAIGHPGVAAEAATIRIGNAAQTRAFIAGIRGVDPAGSDELPVVIDGNGQLGSGQLTGTAIAPGAVAGTHLAPGAAAANLNGSGLSGLVTGSMVLSQDPANTALIDAGFEQFGRLDSNSTIEGWDSGGISTTGAPTARWRHIAKWTGSHMLVWGGDGNSGFANIGGSYDPASDTWTSISTTNAPTARHSHAAVWTGTHLLVWGGIDPQRTNTGGSYDPSTDTWTSISTSNAPTARSFHSAVWTGTRMLVWGGDDGASRLNTGGSYDPATDTWTSISTTNAPTGRYTHAAVWTGTHLLVWGGDDGTSRLNTGGSYDPSTDTWSSVSTANAPAARGSHTAVWTGTHMLVWGGYDGAAYTNTGGRYDPADDTWSPISTTTAPTPRIVHTTIWTGAQLLVWGGYDGAFTNTGGKYDFQPRKLYLYLKP